MRIRAVLAAVVLCPLSAHALAVGAPGRSPSPAAATATAEAEVVRLAGRGRVDTAVQISRATFQRAATAVLARADDYPDALAGAALAAAHGGPILLTPADELPAIVTAELDRLGAGRVLLLGGEAAIGRPVAAALRRQGRAVERVAGRDRFGTAAAVAAALPPSPVAYVASGDGFADALAVGPLAAATTAPILLVTRTTVPAATAAALEERDAQRVVVVGGRAAVDDAVLRMLEDRTGRSVTRIGGPSRLETAALVYDAALAAGLRASEVWLAAAGTFPDAVVAGAAAGARHAPLLLIPGADVFDGRAAAHRLWFRREQLRRVTVLGGPAAIHGAAESQVAELLHPGPHLPGGGRTIFPRHTVVGHYGSTVSPRMGILGEGTPEQAAQRVVTQAAAYDRPTRSVLPLLELIVTIATRSAGPDGDYSTPTTVDSARPYLEAARRSGALLVLDLQPGRSHFLTDLRRYESLLLEPEVGVALDPEWRMGPDQRPGDTIGSVSAAEVNEVSAYLADLVARHDLPEKLFILHHFRASMIRDRSQIVDRDGLALVFHMDGHGTREAKLRTYHALVDPVRPRGFKLFFDEDTHLFSPAEALAIEPRIDLFTYQ